MNRILKSDFAHPGRFVVTLDVVAPDDPRFEQELVEGRKYSEAGYSLGELQDKLGGSEGFLSAPDGSKCHLALSAWLPADPRSRFYPRFAWVPDNPEDAAIIRRILTETDT
ncbi:MAG: hypothetical protein ACRDQ2_03495 [Gaiellales bacterium]